MPAEVFGYSFRNPALLEEALTTPSCRMENPKAHDNQRLEFLGDAILGLLSAERVCEEFFITDQEVAVDTSEEVAGGGGEEAMATKKAAKKAPAFLKKEDPKAKKAACKGGKCKGGKKCK